MPCSASYGARSAPNSIGDAWSITDDASSWVYAVDPDASVTGRSLNIGGDIFGQSRIAFAARCQWP